MIVITGAAGFIGSVLAGKLNLLGSDRLALVDDFSKSQKARNLENKKYLVKTERDEFFDWLENNHHGIDFIFHIGARTDTTEFDKTVFEKLNLNYSKRIWRCCAQFEIPLVYASSAATYGMGEYGYSDNHANIANLKPLNPYGESKNNFDNWVLEQTEKPPFWAGMKFFNVYGPNEYHKSRMASVIFQAYYQIKETGKVKLFRSHQDDYKDGEQLRDFIYVMDVVDVLLFMMREQPESGIYNLGAGKARSFNALAQSVFAALGMAENIEYIDTPIDIRDKYQYFTEAKMDKLRYVGYLEEFFSLEDGIRDYVVEYLSETKYF